MSSRLEFVRPAVVDRFGHLDELLDVQQARTLLVGEFGAEAPSPERLEGELRLFFVVCAGVELYPAFQWHEGRLIPTLRDVLSVLTPHRSAWKILSWFSMENQRLEGARPADLLPFAAAAVEDAARAELLSRSARTL
jgi:hypothetical protein